MHSKDNIRNLFKKVVLEGDVTTLNSLFHGGNNVGLLRRDLLDEPVFDGYTALQKVAFMGNEGMCIALLENGADLEASGKYQRKALHSAVIGGDFNTVDTLLMNCANTLAQDENGLYPIDLTHDKDIRMIISIEMEEKGSAEMLENYKNRHYDNVSLISVDDTNQLDLKLKTEILENDKNKEVKTTFIEKDLLEEPNGIETIDLKHCRENCATEIQEDDKIYPQMSESLLSSEKEMVQELCVAQTEENVQNCSPENESTSSQDITSSTSTEHDAEEENFIPVATNGSRSKVKKKHKKRHQNSKSASTVEDSEASAKVKKSENMSVERQPSIRDGWRVTLFNASDVAALKFLEETTDYEEIRYSPDEGIVEDSEYLDSSAYFQML